MAVKTKTKAKTKSKPVKNTKAKLKAEAIERCKDRLGRVRPEAVIEAARDKNSILHDEFEWNLEKGHQLYLLDRARELIREVRMQITYRDIVLSVPNYISDKSDKTSSYVETTSIRSKSAKAREILSDEVVRIKAALHRSHALSIQFGIEDLWDNMIELAVELEHRLGT